MQEAAEQTPGSMAAIMNLEEEKLQEICHICDVEVANINCPEQIVLTGPAKPIQQAMSLSAEAGAKKCVELNVSGAWHSRCMILAQEKFEPHVRQCNFRDPQIPIVNNIDAKPLQNAEEASRKLINQLCSSVLWQQSMQWFIDSGYEHFVEVGPKKVLRGLMRRVNRQVEVLNVEDGASLAAFLQANQ
jgi:[acyl-carrier-protein] S-malonyltransferase